MILETMDSALTAINTTRSSVEEGCDPVDLAETEAKEHAHQTSVRDLESLIGY